MNREKLVKCEHLTVLPCMPKNNGLNIEVFVLQEDKGRFNDLQPPTATFFQVPFSPSRISAILTIYSKNSSKLNNTYMLMHLVER